MPVFVYRNGKIVDSRKAGPKYAGGSATYVISDEMPETRHMADGKHYTSKKKFRDATKAAGCIEVGNETSTLLKPRQPVQLSRQERVDHIKRAIAQLRG